MKKMIIIFSSAQIVCNIIYILLTKACHAVFTLQNVWLSFLTYAAAAVTLLEIGIILLAIIYIGESIRCFWKMIGITALYLIALDIIKFAMQWGIGLYGFSVHSFLYNALAYLVIFVLFACMYFFFQKYILKKYII